MKRVLRMGQLAECRGHFRFYGGPHLG